jgi:formylglycine-generating enzyme required for sulfatase activity
MFEYDVFLSYSSKDKSIIHPLTNRLKQDDLRVWLDEWAIKPGDSIPIKIQHGLEKSHTLLMCMSPAYFGSEWGTMESYSLLFRDPTNKQRRLIPLLITDCIRPDFIAHLKYIDLRTPSDEAYNDILDSCRENKEIPKTLTSPSTSIEFVLIPSGKFMMGSPSDEQDGYIFEYPVHEVAIKNSFYTGKYPVTQKQWERVMGSTPSHFKGEYLPVESVSLNDVQEFIKKLNEMESTFKYRLPSEAEWEYACRAGTTTRYSFGDNDSKLENYAWYDKNSNDRTHPVGQKSPNPWGLYDMHGNIWEWCPDKWHKSYDGAPSDGSVWESGDHSSGVVRSGANAKLCRSANRGWHQPNSPARRLGFRLVRDV